MLVAPLLVFICVTFAAPIADMLLRSVDNRLVAEVLPRTVVELARWDGEGLPPEDTFAALAHDLQEAVAVKTHTRLGSRLNHERPGTSSLMRRTGRAVRKWDLADAGPFQERFAAVDDGWVDPGLWRFLQANSGRYTAGYFLNAADLQRQGDEIALRPDDERIYLLLFGRTLAMSLLIMLACLALGYPVAYLLASLPLRYASLLLILVLLPFWTSFLVRTSAWKVILQREGLVNDTLVMLGLVTDDTRLRLINNQFGTMVAMTHILLPYMILPLFSVMCSIPTSYVRAAKSLGASPWTAFQRVYLPQTIPGVGAGCILVFILAIGYYITPELVGGTTGTFISNRIAYHISTSLNWGLAAALGTLLLLAVLALYYAYDRIVGIDNLRLG